jgi:carbon starvation protein
MNAMVLGIIVLGLFYLGYHNYGKRIERLWDIDPSRPTPAKELYDGIDFVPARHWFFLFGHHFAAIAGAAPIIGPVIAVAIWGWGPAIIWILIGCIFMGGVHDYGALMASIRHQGRSIADIAGDIISKRTRLLFSLFIWLTLILVVAVFIFLSAKTYVEDPKIIIPSLGLIPIAILVGFMLYNLKANQIATTLLGLVLLIVSIVLGNYLPVDLGKNGLTIWIIVLLVYCFAASVTPVQILLQPRDYLCGLILGAGIAFGYGGLLITHPSIHAPAFISLKWEHGVMLWPLLFVTIACGAISGFHSLIAGGTTSKQLSNERDGKKVGYGSMLMEGTVAALATLVVISGIKEHQVLSQMLAKGGPGPIAAFACGYKTITSLFFGDFGGMIAVIILNSFILSSLDAGTRIGRYIIQELFKVKNRYIATFIMVILSGSLALSGKWKEIWPVFGASNQLVAALALIVITSWLLSQKKAIRYTLIPAIFVLITAVGALIHQIYSFLISKNYLLMVIASVLVVLAVFVCSEAFPIFRQRERRPR